MSNLYNLEYEKQTLSAIINNPGILSDLPEINEKDFSNTNRVVFQAIKNIVSKGNSVNKFVLIETLKSLNIKIADSIEPAVYIEALEMLAVPYKSGIEIAKELKKTRIRRDLNTLGKEIQAFTEKDEGKKAIELVTGANEIFNKKINVINSNKEDEPVDLFGTAEDYITELGNNPHIDGIQNPYEINRSLFGDLYKKSLQCLVARPKVGKSTWLMNIATKCAQQDTKDEFICLLLDSEMPSDQVQRRAISSISKVGDYFLRTGYYKNNAEMSAKVAAAFKTFGPLKKKIHHIYCGAQSIDQIISTIRRFHNKHVNFDKNKKFLICYDYLKLSYSDAADLQKTKDYLLVGQKIDKLKDLISELDCPLYIAAQANRKNEGKHDSQKQDDGNVVGLSDEISKLASNVSLLEKLSLENIAQFGRTDITHSLKCLYQRDAGPNPDFEFVKYQDARGNFKYAANCLFYNFDYFNVEEKYDLRTLLKETSMINIDMNNGGLKKDLF
jgi:replicative DNA helicase